MALKGSVTAGYWYADDGTSRGYTLSWTAEQSIENNQSTISWTLSTAGSYPYTVAERTLEVVIAGETVVSKTDRVMRGVGTVTTGTKTIDHAADGTQSFSVSVKAAVYYSSVNCSNSATFTLDTIPRTSGVSMGTGTMGSASTITISRATSSFTHTLEYYFGDASDTIATKTASTSVSWTPPLALANQVPNATYGTGTLRCITYSGNTKIGQKDISITLNVPSSVIPTIDSASLEIDNSNNEQVADWGVCVTGYTKVKVQASASGQYGSTISSYTISDGYSTTQNGATLDYTGGVLTSSGDITFNVVAKDSRSRNSASETAGTLTFYPYSNPRVNEFIVARSELSAKTLVIQTSWEFSSVNELNSITATLYYKKPHDFGWTEYGEIIAGSDITLDDIEFDEASSYDFQLVVTDLLGNSDTSNAFISTIEVLLDFRAGGKGLGIGKIAESDSMEVALDARFMRNVYIYDAEGTAMTLADYILSVVNG